MVVAAVSLTDVPRSPAIYAFFGGLAPRSWVAYVGQAGNLAQRLSQHLERHDSSVTTGSSAVGLNVEHVTHVAWWLHPSFTDKDRRLAAELVAFGVLDPALRSRGGVSQAALDLSEEPQFAAEMRALLSGDPAAIYRPARLADLADRVERMEATLRRLEALLSKTPGAAQ